ncbi:MAG TPA: threonine--tRNA ligase [Acidobacteriota bacterium]
MSELIDIQIGDKQLRVASDTRAGELLDEHAPEWRERGIGVQIGGEVLDFQTPLRRSGELRPVIPGDNGPEALDLCRHTTSHVLAQAVKQLYENVQVGIGPATDEGFYYDFLRDDPFTPEDLERIEERMRELIAADQPLQRHEMAKQEAEELFAGKHEALKVELIRDKGGARVSCYQQGEFIDFCTGPHLPSTGRIPAVKLLHTAAAHWRGRTDAPMMQRIYGTAFFSEEELEAHLARLEEAQKRDHRRLGVDLDLFHFDETAGPGMAYWHPKGAMVRHQIETFLRNEQLGRGYDLVYTPHIARHHLWETSGHYSYYKDHMFLLDVDEQEYVLKPMNCPGHILIYQKGTRSYRDLPIRYSEFGTVYRNELSGVLHGMLRVRGFTQDDAHIFCRPEQIQEEVSGALDLALHVMRTFGYEEYRIDLSLHDPDDRAKYAGDDAQWALAEGALADALDAMGLVYERKKGEAAFYGPKVDFHLIDALGRPWQGSTVQLDFNLPERFDLHYVGEDGRQHRTVMIHRAIYGSLERFVGGLIEHYAGAFPLWLAPVQVVVLPIADRHLEYAERTAEALEEGGLRAEVDRRSQKMGAKIRDAQLQKVPFMLVVGDREAESGEVSVRHRSAGDLGSQPLPEFIAQARRDIDDHAVQEWPLRQGSAAPA